MVERFGRYADRNLHFTLRNETEETRFVEMTLDADALGLDAAPRASVWLMRDAHTPEPLTTDRRATEWQVSFSVPAKDTVVLRVATPHGIALDRLAAVPEALRRGANYRDALRGAGVVATYPDYEELIQSVQAVQVMLRAEALQSTDVLAQLRTLERALETPDVPSETGETARWVKRLTECTTMALGGISSAVRVLSHE
jgi:hypothetical protein